MGIIISASNPQCHSRPSKPILKILSVYRKNILGKQLSQAISSKYVFRLPHAPKFQVFSIKSSMMVKLFFKKAALMNFIEKRLRGSLFFNKVSRLQAKERLLCRCFPVNFTKYFTTLLLQNTSGWLLLLNTLLCSLRCLSHKKCFLRPWLF